MIVRVATAVACAWLASAAGAEERRPLTFSVGPSGIEAEARPGETLEQKLERRLRQSDAMFRHICNGCGRGVGSPTESPFRPIETLGRSMPAERLETPDE